MNCIITGGTKGIGRAIATIFAENGFNLAIVARSTNDLEAMEKDFESKYPIEVHTFPTDLSQKDQVLRFCELIQTHWDKVDVLVNNAGMFVQGSMLEEDDGLMEQMMTVNFFSAYHLTRSVAPMMIEQGKGHIFNICSVASIKAFADSGSYVASKFALLGFTRSLRLELLDKNVSVTAVLPGSTDTASWEGADIDSERLMDPKDVAKAVWSAWQMSERTVVEEILLRPRSGDL